MTIYQLPEVIGRLLLATVLGAIIGIEREYRQKAAGVRTNALIALGSCLFTMVGLEMVPPGTDPTRVASTIVTGIGFLGGGAILRTGHTVRGLTTAATIWVNAAIGMATAVGLIWVAAVTTGITLVVLRVFPIVEDHIAGREPPPRR